MFVVKKGRIFTPPVSAGSLRGITRGLVMEIAEELEIPNSEPELTRYDVRSDSVVRITFQVVTRGHRGECKVRARDRSGEETGSQIVPVHPSGRRSQLVSVDLTTRARAVDGELIGCRRLGARP